MPSKNILVVGGAGYIGSHVAKLLATAGYQPIIFDNLSFGNQKTVADFPFFEGDLANPKDLEAVFSKYAITAVMHFAALIDVGESVRDPAKYYRQNVAYTLNLLESMRQNQINTIIFSSSAAIFGNPTQPRIAETHPTHPINPYGETKLMIEKILRDYDSAYGLKSSCLRYFNAAGGDPKGQIKYFKKHSTNLIPLILASLKNPQKGSLTINGTDYPTPDGTCVRDYIHIDDIGRAHLLAMEKLLKDRISTAYNLGNGDGFSIREVIAATEKVTGLKVNVIEGPRRAGDPPILIADSHKARRELNWIPQYKDLETMISHAWHARH